MRAIPSAAQYQSYQYIYPRNVFLPGIHHSAIPAPLGGFSFCTEFCLSYMCHSCLLKHQQKQKLWGIPNNKVEISFLVSIQPHYNILQTFSHLPVFNRLHLSAWSSNQRVFAHVFIKVSCVLPHYFNSSFKNPLLCLQQDNSGCIWCVYGWCAINPWVLAQVCH